MRKNILKVLFCAAVIITNWSTVRAQDLIKLNTQNSKSIHSEIEFAVIRQDSTVGFLTFEKGANVRNINLKSVFHLSEDFDFEQESGSEFSGKSVLRFQQTYKSIPIVGSEYIVRKDGNRIIGANGFYVSSTDLLNSNIPTLSKERALQLALDAIEAKEYMWESAEREFHIKALTERDEATYRPNAKLVYTSSIDRSLKNKRLAYQFEVYAKSPLGKYRVEVDAHSGEIIKKYNTLHTTDTQGTGQSFYNGVVDLNLYEDNGNYELRDYTRGEGVFTYDMENGVEYQNAVMIAEPDNFINEEYNKAGVSAHFGAAATYDYFMEKFGLNSFDGNGSAINSFVRFDYNFFNAFWDGYQMTYGDGDGVEATALTSLDIIGHEIAHAVTQYSADLVYEYESGALNESFSDIFGQSIEFYAAPETASWNLGDEIFINGVDMIRSMSDPNSQGQPDTYLGNLWYTGSGDNGGVHYNSGVQNYWFYLLVEGGIGTNDNNQDYDVPSIGLEKAQQIAFRNLNYYLTSYSTYIDARVGSENAAIDLYGENSPEYYAVREAWNAVGVPSIEPTLELDNSINLGLLLANERSEFIINIRNGGLSDLEVDSVTFSNSNFTAAQNSFTVVDGSIYGLLCEFSSSTIDQYDERVFIHTNAGIDSVDLFVNVVEEPNFEISEDSISITALKGDIKPVSFDITNYNNYDVSFSLSKTATQSNTTFVPTGKIMQVGKTTVPEYAKSNIKSIVNSTDENAYVWSDSNDGVSFSWIEISGVGTPVSLSDDSYRSDIDMSMSFPFYGNEFNTVNICSNGWVSFTTRSSQIWNAPLPSTSVPNNVIALLAADLHPGSNGQCYYYYDEASEKFIVQYNQWRYYGGIDKTLTIQLQLSKNGDIKLLYKDVLTDPYGTVGIQNEERTSGITIAYDGLDQISSGYAVQVSNLGNTDWLSFEKDSVTVAANSSVLVKGFVNTNLLDAGNRALDMSVSLNEFDVQDSLVHLNVEVVEGANLVTDSFINFEPIFTSDSSIKSFVIKSSGTDTLNISNAFLENGSEFFDLVLDSQSLYPGDSILVDVVFSSNAAGIYADTFKIESNDLEMPIHEIVLNAESLDPPAITVLPEQISLSTDADDSVTVELIVSNELGNSNLYFDAQVMNYERSETEGISLNDLSQTKVNKVINPYENKIPKANIEQKNTSVFDLINYINSNSEAKLFGASEIEDAIFDINPASGEINQRFFTSKSAMGPEGLAFDGQYLYFNYDFEDKVVYKLDVATGEIVDQFNYSLDISGLAHSGTYLYMCSYSTGDIYKVDFSTKEIVETISIGFAYDGLSFGGTRGTLFFSDFSQIYEYSLEENTIVNSSYLDAVWGMGYSNALGALFARTYDGIKMLDPNTFEELNSFSLSVTGIATDEVGGYVNNGWLSLSSYADTVVAGNTMNIEAILNASGLFGGTYTADIQVSSNDPLNENLTVPVTFEVIGYPVLEVERDTLNFERRLVGSSDSARLTIANPGTETLSVSLGIGSNDFMVSEPELSIPPKFSQTVTVLFNPETIGHKNVELILTSNDEQNPRQSVILSAEALADPSISFSDEELILEMSSSEERITEVEVVNDVDFDYDLVLSEMIEESNRSVSYQKTNDTKKVGKVELPKFVKSGSKSAKNNEEEYSWIDSESGATYDWFDISQSGTPISLTDDSNVSDISLGMSFPFYNEEFNTVNVSSNGWVSFTNTYGSIWSTPLPSTIAPENVIAILSTDLVPGSGQCYVQQDAANNRFIIQYEDWRYYGGSGTPLTMQIQLYTNGKIKLLYEKIEVSAYGTVGIQNALQDQGITIAYDEPSRIISGYAVEISKSPEWLALSTNNLNLDGNESSSFNVITNSEGLLAGIYNGYVIFNAPEFNMNIDTLEVSINVAGEAKIDVDSTLLNFDKLIVGDTASLTFAVYNQGNQELTGSFEFAENDFTISPNSLVLQPFSQETFTVSFNPSEVRDFTSVLTINSNDEDNSALEIDLVAFGANPAEMTVSVNEIVKAQYADEITTSTVELLNSANSIDLDYSISIAVSEETNAKTLKSKKESRNIGFYSVRKNLDYVHEEISDRNISKTLLFMSNDRVIDSIQGLPERTSGGVTINSFTYYVSYGTNELIKYSLTTNEVVESFAIHSEPYGIAYDGEYLWIGDYNGVVRGYDLDGNIVGDFDLPFRLYPALTYFNGNLLATPFAQRNSVIQEVDFTGNVVNTFDFNNEFDLMQFTDLNNSLWCLGIRNGNSNNLEFAVTKLELSAQDNQVSISDSVYIATNEYGYSLINYNNDILLSDWLGNGYVINSGFSGWLTVDRATGTIESSSLETLTFTFDSEGLEDGLYEGTITIASNDPNQPEKTLNVMMSVGNFPPELVSEIPDISVYNYLDTVFTMNMNEYFIDQEGDDINFELEFDSNIANIRMVSSNEMELSGKEIGMTEVSVFAHDGITYSTSSFNFEVLDYLLSNKKELEKLQLYPNPTVNATFNIDTDKELDFEVYTLKGEKVSFLSRRTISGYQIKLHNSEKGLYLIKGITSNHDFYSGAIILR